MASQAKKAFLRFPTARLTDSGENHSR